MGITRDGSARSRRTRSHEQQESDQLLAHLGRVALLGRLSGAVAHELVQPLTAILANARAALHVAMRDAATTRELKQLLRDIIRDDLRAAKTIQRLRSLLARGEIQRRLIDLSRTVRDVVGLLHSDLIARGVEVTLQLAPQASFVLADDVQIQQVLLNLIVNACDAMADAPPEQRSLSIATRVTDGRMVECSVTDCGHGVPPQRLEQIFEPFVSTRTDGLGLGLAICRAIVEAHGGQLWAENNAERGATFYFTVGVGARAKRLRRSPSTHAALV